MLKIFQCENATKLSQGVHVAKLSQGVHVAKLSQGVHAAKLSQGVHAAKLSQSGISLFGVHQAFAGREVHFLESAKFSQCGKFNIRNMSGFPRVCDHLSKVYGVHRIGTGDIPGLKARYKYLKNFVSSCLFGL